MAKKDAGNLNDKIKKAVPDNKWLMNVAKSLGFTSMEIVKDLMPNTTNFVEWNKDEMSDTMNMIKEMRANTGMRNTFSKQFKNIPQVKIANKALKNAWSDAKSGKFYNNDRLNSFDDDDFDFGFGDDFGDDEIEFIDDDGDGEPDTASSQGSASRPPVTVINTMPLAKAISSSTEATVNTMVSVAEQQMAIETQKIMFNHDSTNAMLNAMGSINDNLSLLVRFNAESTAKYHAAAMKYYEQSLELLQEKNKKPGKDDDDEKLSPFFDSGVFNFGDYKKIVKENIESMVDENMIASTIKDVFLNETIMEGFAKNPIGTAVNMVIQAKLPGVVKSTLTAFDESINSVIPALIAKVSTFDDSDNPLLEQLSKIFGYEQKLDKKVKLGDYEKGRIDWDGESKKALVEVIPTYLRRIESALTGQDERVYNYDTGEFTSMETLRKDFDKKLKEKMSSSFAYDTVRRQLEDKLRKLNATDEVIEKFNDSIQTYFAEMTESGKMINPFKRKGPDGETIDELTEILNGDQQSAQLIQRLLKTVSKHDLKNMVTVGLQDSFRATQQFYDEIKANPNLSGYAALNNDKTAREGVRYTGQLGPRDAFGLSQLDYLRDIKTILSRGIKVFPDNRRRFGYTNPNQDMLDGMAAEIPVNQRREAERERQRTNSIYTVGNDPNVVRRSSNDITSMSEEDWNQTLEIRETEFEDNALGNAMRLLDRVNNRVDDFVYDVLFGDENYQDRLREKINDFKEKHGGEGRNRNGVSMLNQIRGVFRDTVNATKSFFTGQPYMTSDGIRVEGSPNNIFNQLRGFFTGLPEKLYNKTDGGILGKFATDFMDGFKQFKISLFGQKALSEKAGQETIKDLGRKVKERLPKAIGYGIGGAVIKTAFASNLGILGNFLLPGGPLGAALMGTTFGFLKQSETFNRYVFGEKDADGNRVGGIISKAWQDRYDEYSGVIKKGAGIGLMASLFLPGGPIAGAIMGMGAGILSKNEAFQEFLYGKDFDKDNKSLMDGTFGKLFKKMSGGNTKLAKFLGTAGVGVGLAQGVGLLPSFLLPGGPITGAVLGLAGGIAASSEKFQKFLFGDQDVDGKRYGGLMTQFTNWMNVSFMQPLKLKATAISDSVYGFLRSKLLDPISRSFEPVLYAFKNMAIDIKDGIVRAFHNITDPVVDGFREHVIKPLGEKLGKIINPIKKMIFGAFKLLGKGLVNVLASPLKVIDLVGGMAERYNERSVLNREQRRREKEFDETDSGPLLTRYFRRKQAVHMSKDEREALLNEQLGYRKGKTRKQRKKDQKKELKEEMLRRKDRREEMQRQFEEDRAFAKENKYKFASKRQKEEREQMLRDKQIWLQELLTNKVEDTSEKVGKISDGTDLLVDSNTKIVDKLEEVKDAIVNTFNRVMGNDKSNNVTPIPKRDPESKSTLAEKLEGNKVIDLNRKLQEEGKSHADGLDEVPEDGYIAELHEGEMVVPKKQAGTLRGLMGGLGNAIGGMANMFGSVLNAMTADKRDRNDNALGLSDEEAEQQKELLDRDRKSKVSRKNVDFIQNQLATEAKEKEERNWRNSILAAVQGIATAKEKKELNLFDLLKKGFNFIKDGVSSLLNGLGNLGSTLAGHLGSLATAFAVPAAVGTLISEWNDFKNTEEYKESRTDVDADGDGQGDFIYDNTDVQIGKNIISARNPLIIKPLKAIDKHVVDPMIDGGKYIAKKGQEVYNSKLGQKTLKPVKEALFGKKGTEVVAETTSNVVSFADAKLAKEGSGKAVSKAIGNTVEVSGGSKGLIGKFIDVVKQALSFVGEKVAEKFPKMASFVGKADGVLKTFVKNADSIVSKFSKKITAFVTGLGVKSNPVGLAVDLVFAVGDLVSGATAGNAGNLFGVSPENVDVKMRGISAVLQTLTNYNALAIISLVNEITSAMWNFNFLRNVAIWIYNAIPGGSDLTSRITAKQIDSCKSIEEALQIMGIVESNDIARLQENGQWKDFANVSNESLGGVISSTEQMELARLQYNLANGTKLSSQAFIDKESKTLGSKIVDGTKKVGKSIGKAYNTAKDWVGDKYNAAKDWTVDKYNKAKDWTVDKYNKAKDWTVDKYNKAKDWTGEKLNQAKDWVGEKAAIVKGKVERQLDISDNVADIMMGDNSAKSNMLTNAITGGSTVLTKLYNSTIGKMTGSELEDDTIAEIIGLKINQLIVEPFRDVKGKATKWFNDTKEAISGWVTNTKDTVLNWVKENVSEPFNNWYNKKKDQFNTMKNNVINWMDNTKQTMTDFFRNKIQEPFSDWVNKKKDQFSEMKNNVLNWMDNAKAKVTDWFGDNIKAPFSEWYEKKKDQFAEMKDSVKSWVNGFKTSVSDAFTTYIKEPFKNAVSSVLDYVQPLLDFGEKVKNFFGWNTDKLNEMANKAEDDVNANDDAGRSGPKPTDRTRPAGRPTPEMPGRLPVRPTGIPAGNRRPMVGDIPSTPMNKIRPVKHDVKSTDLRPASRDGMGRVSNNFVFYSQSDERWRDAKIGKSTMKDSGCGPTSMAMAISQLTGERITPDTVARLGAEHLPGYSQYSLFPSVAQKLNMNYNEGRDARFITTNLKKGIPVILSGRSNVAGTPYTNEGHVVTASHIRGNSVYVQDPRGERYSGYYPVSALLRGINKGMIMSPSNRTDVSKFSGGHINEIKPDRRLQRQDSGIYGEIGEYDGLNMGETGAAQVTVADRVLSYARAFLANTSKFKYSQAQSKTTGRHGIDNNNIGADCSSFVSHIMSVAGDRGKVAYLSGGWWTDAPGTIVSDPQIGDVVCQEGHVGLYSGDGKYIHMSGRKDGIKESKAIQRGNNKHRGYRRFLKDPSAMVDPTIVGGNSLLGTVVATSSGNPVMSGGGTAATPTTDATTGATATASAAPETSALGVFSGLERIANNMVASIFNGKQVDLYAGAPATATTDATAGTTPTSTTGNPDITNISDTAKAVWTFFTGKGYTPQAAAGILGNMTQESGVDPTAIQGGGRGPAAGICQWENINKKSARWKQLSDYAASKGKDWKDLQSQLEFLDMELSGTGNVDKYTSTLVKRHAGSYEGFKQINDVNKAVKVFHDAFERSSKPNWNRRYSSAQTYFDQFKSGSSDVSVGAGGGFTMATAAEAAPSDGSIPTSMNGWAYYKQGDPQWQEDINGKKIGPSGCGMASHAMMLTSMFGKQVTPVTVGKWARANGHWSNGMSWAMPQAIATKLGLNIVKTETNANGLPTSALENLKAQLKAGYPAILSGQGNSSSYDTPFTGGGHIVFAVGVDGNNHVIINDPRGPNRTKAYTDDGMLNIGKGLRGYWAFDKPAGATLPNDWAGSNFTATPGSTAGTTAATTTGATATASATPDTSSMFGVFSGLERIGNSMVSSIFNEGKTSIATPTTTATATSPTGGSTPASGSGNFPKYNLNEKQLKGIANILQHEQPGYEGRQAEASLMANLTDISGDDKATVDNLIKKATGGWFAHGKTRFNNPGNPEQMSIDAARKVLVEGKRTIPRYVNEHDCFSDLTSVTNNGTSFKASDRSQYKPFVTKIKNRYGSSGTFHSFPNSKSDPFYYTSEANRQKWGEDCYAPTPPAGDAGQGDGPVRRPNIRPARTTYSRSIMNNRPNIRPDVETQRNIDSLNRKINVAVNNVNASDPNAYAEILKLIMEELRAINGNTAETARGVNGIEVVSANEPIRDNMTRPRPTGTPTRQNRQQQTPSSSNRQLNSTTGYKVARQMAGYTK